MAANVGQRHIEDTLNNRKLNALESAMKLSLHTVKICSNENIFIPQYKDVTADIVKTATMIYVYAKEANDIPAQKTYKNYKENAKNRLTLEQQSISLCSKLLGLINISQRLFHLKSKKVGYWTELVKITKTQLKSWYSSEQERFRDVS